MEQVRKGSKGERGLTSYFRCVQRYYRRGNSAGSRVLMACSKRFVCAIGVMLFVAGLQANGCSNSSSAANHAIFSWESDPKPPRIGSNTFTIKLAGSRGEKLAGARVSLEGDMSHAGMSPAFGEAKEVAPGQYQGKLDLNMRGDWTVLFHIVLKDGLAFDRQVKIQNLQAN